MESALYSVFIGGLRVGKVPGFSGPQKYLGPGLALLMVHVCSCMPAYRMEIGQALISRSGLTLISDNVA